MKTILLAILTASIAIASIAHAKSHKPEKIVSRVTEKLSLNDNQQNLFRAFIDEKQALRAERREKREKRKQLHKENKTDKEHTKHAENGPFASLFTKESISVDDVNHVIDKMHEKKREKNKNVVATFVTFYNSLDSQQRDRIKPMLHKMLRNSIKQHRKNKVSFHEK